MRACCLHMPVCLFSQFSHKCQLHPFRHHTRRDRLRQGRLVLAKSEIRGWMCDICGLQGRRQMSRCCDSHWGFRDSMKRSFHGSSAWSASVLCCGIASVQRPRRQSDRFRHLHRPVCDGAGRQMRSEVAGLVLCIACIALPSIGRRLDALASSKGRRLVKEAVGVQQCFLLDPDQSDHLKQVDTFVACFLDEHAWTGIGLGIICPAQVHKHMHRSCDIAKSPHPCPWLSTGRIP